VEKLQEEKLHLLDEIDEVSKERVVKVQDEEQIKQMRQLSVPDVLD
jgi:hypothetical protein